MRRFAALLVALGLGLAVLVLPGTPAWACSCVAGDAESQAEWADQVFIATATGTREGDGWIEMTLAVDEVFKGEVDATTIVVTASSPASCGLAEIPGEGETWLFYTNSAGILPDRGEGEAPTALRTGLCTGTGDIPADYDDVLAASLGEPTEPRGGADATGPDGATGDTADDLGGDTADARGGDATNRAADGVPLWPWVTGLLLIALVAALRVARRTT